MYNRLYSDYIAAANVSVLTNVYGLSYNDIAALLFQGVEGWTSDQVQIVMVMIQLSVYLCLGSTAHEHWQCFL